MVEDERPGADLAAPCRRVRVGPYVVIEPPGPNPLTEAEHLRRALRVGELAQHAVVGPDGVRLGPAAVAIADLDEAAKPGTQHGRRPEHRPGPDALPLDFRVERERRVRGRRQPEVGCVPEGVAAEAET